MTVNLCSSGGWNIFLYIRTILANSLICGLAEKGESSLFSGLAEDIHATRSSSNIFIQTMKQSLMVWNWMFLCLSVTSMKLLMKLLSSVQSERWWNAYNDINTHKALLSKQNKNSRGIFVARLTQFVGQGVRMTTRDPRCLQDIT